MPVATLASRAPVRSPVARPRSRSRTPMRVRRSSVPARRAMVGPPLVHLRPSRSLSGPVPDSLRQLVAAPGAGETLPSRIQMTLEESFDVSLQPVRVHLDPRANAAAESLGARAFTFGAHVFLGPGESPMDLGLMAHEVAHVVQQQGAPVLQTYTSAATSGDFEQEANRASAAVQRGEASPVHGRTGGPTVQRQPGFFQRGWNVLRRGARALAQFAEGAGWALLNRFAPELVPIMRRGPLEWLKEKISWAVEALLDTVMSPVRAIRGVASSLMGSFTNLLNWLREAAAGIAQGNCRALSEAAGKIHQVFDAVVGPIIEPLKNAARRVKDGFAGLWDRYGAPAWQFVQRMGGRAVESIQQFGRWIWERAAPIRRGFSTAWTWVKNQLGVGEGVEGQDGIFQWIQRRVQAVWDRHIKPFIERYKRPLLVVAGILIMLSPAGPFIALGGAIAGVAAGVRWIRQNLATRDGVVNARTSLERTLIPNILNGVNRVSSFLMEKARAITDGLRNVVGGLNQAIGAVEGTILNFVVGVLRWILDRFQEFVRWATEKLVGFAEWIGRVLGRLVTFLQPVLNFLRRVGTAVANVMRLPYELGSRIWNAIPACIRDPFIDFFIPLILRQIPFFRELAATPEAWRETRSQIMGLVRQIFRDFDLLGAMRTAFRIVVRALRIPTDLVAQLLDKAARAWDAVIAAPLRFIENSLKAILRGVGRFMRNFLSHLWFGVQGWLLNAVEQSGTGIRPPASWEPRAIFGFVLDVLGISLEHVLELLARRVGRPIVDRIRRAINFLTGAWEWVKVAIEEGPAGLWRMVSERVGNLARMVLESAVGWVMTRIIAIVSVRLTAMAASAGFSAILEAIVAVYQAIQTAMEYARRILEIMLLVFNTAIQIAQGVIDPAAQAVERGLRMAMPIVIGFLANYAGLGGIGGRIREIVVGVRERVDAAILYLIDRALAAGRWILDRLRAGAAAVTEWWRARKTFRADGQEHAVYIEGSGTQRQVMVASTPAVYRTALNALTLTGAKVALRTQALGVLTRIENAMTAAAGTGPAAETAGARIDGLMGQLAALTGQIKSGGVAGAPTTAMWGPPGPGNFGTSVTVERLATLGGGSGPTITTGDWPTLAQRMDGRSTYYVRGHLLNDNLGGPGNDWKNLTPLTQATNNRSAVSMLHLFENAVKDAVGAGNSVNLTVIATYGRPARTADINSAKKIAPPDGPIIENIIRAERNVPTSVRCTSHKITAAGVRTPLVNRNVENTLDTNIAHYSLGGSPRTPMDINTAAPALLRTLNGVDATVATRIIGLRTTARFVDRNDAMTRIGPEIWHRMVSTAGIRIRTL